MKATDLCSLDDVRDALGLKAGETADDPKLERRISAVSERIARSTGREFVSRNATFTTPGAPVFGELTIPEETRTFVADGGTYLRIGDLQELTSATSNGTAADIAGWQKLPYTGPPWTTIEYAVASAIRYNRGVLLAITGKWGFPEIPEAIRQACIDQVVAEWKRRAARRSELAVDAEGRRVGPRSFESEVWDVLTSFRRTGPVLI